MNFNIIKIEIIIISDRYEILWHQKRHIICRKGDFRCQFLINLFFLALCKMVAACLANLIIDFPTSVLNLLVCFVNISSKSWTCLVNIITVPLYKIFLQILFIECNDCNILVYRLLFLYLFVKIGKEVVQCCWFSFKQVNHKWTFYQHISLEYFFIRIFWILCFSLHQSF